MKKEAKLTKKIYSENVNEWDRLFKDPFHRLEFDTTFRFLKKYLPKKGLVFDAGGGPGRYSIELAKAGYNIVLLDLVPQYLEIARKKIKQAKVQSCFKDIIEGNITDLSKFKTNSFDAVLCLGGVLSHIHPEKERRKVTSELVRVAKHNAPIFVSVIGKFGTIARFFPGKPDEVKDTEHFRRIYSKGDDYLWYGGKNSYSHYFELNELKNLFDKRKIKFLKEVGLQGLSSPSQELINEMAEKEHAAWKNWLEAHYKLCTHPSVADTSLHFMVIVRKIG